jgi:hypothetical protein
LYYAHLLKDAGCSTNASRMLQPLGSDDIKAKRDVKTTDWTRVGWESFQYAFEHVRTGEPFLDRVRGIFSLAINRQENAREVVQIRCELGASIGRRLGLPEATASAIHSLDELWNGRGQPQGLRGAEIPLFSRIMNLSQTLDVFYSARGRAAVIEVARKRSGSWFDPDLVHAFRSLAKNESFWDGVSNAGRRVLDLEPASALLDNSEATLDNICLAFADVIDAKSPFTYRHSAGVADAATAIGTNLRWRSPRLSCWRGGAAA